MTDCFLLTWDQGSRLWWLLLLQLPQLVKPVSFSVVMALSEGKLSISGRG